MFRRVGLASVGARPSEHMRDLRHAVPVLSETAIAKKNEVAMRAKQCDHAAVVRWHRHHFHDRLPAGPVLLKGEYEIAAWN